MLDLEGVNLSLLIKGDEEVFLCYERLRDSDQKGLTIKARCDNRKFLRTCSKTGDSDSIRLLIWKNSGANSIYQMINPDITIEKDFVKIDLEKEFASLGVTMYEGEEFNSRYLMTRGRFPLTCAEGIPVSVGTYGYYYTRHTWLDCSNYDLYFRFASPGVKIFRNRVREIKIDTFDGISRMDEFYEFINSVMDGSLECTGYSEEKLTELMKNHLPKSMYIELTCENRVLRAGIDHLGGEPRRWFESYAVENEEKIDYTGRIASEDPLENVIYELKKEVVGK